jgi:hypothetical protein
MLLTCDAANWGQLPADWRTGSLKVGPLWFVGGRRSGYVHRGRFQGPASAIRWPGRLSGGVMIVEVSAGSTVVMKAADSSRPYFHLFDGFNGSVGNALPDGDTGFTFKACPRGYSGPNGLVTDFNLGFSIEAGRMAPVEVQTSPTSRPIRVIFTSPK